LTKRMKVAKRDVKFISIQFAVPILLCVAAFVVQRVMFSTTVGGELAFDGRTYRKFNDTSYKSNHYDSYSVLTYNY
jgi:hypothetical protein